MAAVTVTIETKPWLGVTSRFPLQGWYVSCFSCRNPTNENEDIFHVSSDLQSHREPSKQVKDQDCYQNKLALNQHLHIQDPEAQKEACNGNAKTNLEDRVWTEPQDPG